MTNAFVPEIRYDFMTDRALLDDESTKALHQLSMGWARPKLHPRVARARVRSALIQRGWRALAELRTNEPFLLVRRASGVTKSAITPLACINLYA